MNSMAAAKEKTAMVMMIAPRDITLLWPTLSTHMPVIREKVNPLTG